jgi:hypothetical protein
MNWPVLGAALAASVLVAAHGIVGHGWHRAQLRDVVFKPTSIVGDADAAHRFFEVTWHIVTVFFLSTAGALYAIAFDLDSSAHALHFVELVYLLVIVVCLAYFGRRPSALLRPIPSIAAVSMVAIVVLAWIGDRTR